ncbi:MAG: hypothetical protein M0Q98_11925 [Pseudomonas sp.]|nr:hypothetical protein [Pseudomonas sp.]MDD2222912.1 hypothetical protein [Pseudomonas sp.]MDY0414276.1 hypothetical protein [Pseudomonas sp.]NLO55071.1 hypothetical protein [Gammaproteobacteria bacterium]
MGVFFLGVVCGCIATLLYQKISRWLSIRALPAQKLEAHPVRYRNDGAPISKDYSGQ